MSHNPCLIGGPILVNTETYVSQFRPHVAVGTDGTFAVAWQDNSRFYEGNSYSLLRFQKFSHDGSRIGDEVFLGESFLSFSYEVHTVLSLNNGPYIVPYEVIDYDAADSHGFFLVEPDGDVTELPTQSSGTDTNFSYDAKMIDRSRFLLTWSGQAGGEFGSDVFAQIYNVDGSLSTPTFMVNSTTSGFQVSPEVETLTNGNFVIAWNDESKLLGSTPNDYAVVAKIFSADGSAVTGEIVLNSGATSYSENVDIASLPGGGFVAVWDALYPGPGLRSRDVYARTFDANGNPVSAELLVNTTTDWFQYTPVVAGLSSGGFLVAWFDGATDNPGPIRAQLFDGDGEKVGGEILVSE